MRIFSLSLAFFCTISFAFAQNKVKLDSLKAVLETSMADTQKVNRYNALIYAYKRNDSLEITRYASLAIALAQKAQYPKGLVKTYDRLGDLARQSAFHSKANKIYQLMLKASKKYNYPKGEAHAYLGFGIIQYIQSNYDQALVYFKKSLKISQTIKDQSGIANAYHYLGGVFDDQGNYPKALEYHHKALKIRGKLGNQAHLADTHNNIGAVYIAQGNYSQALNQFFKDLQIQQKLGNKSSIADSYNNIGAVYETQGDFKKALEYYFKSLKMLEELGNRLKMSASYNNIGVTYRMQKKYTLAQNYYAKSLEINLEKADKYGIANNHYNIGETYLIQKKYDKALTYLDKSLNISFKIGNKSLTSSAYIALGQTYRALKNHPKAVIYLNKGIALATKIGSPLITQDGYETLAQIHKTQGDYKAAFENYVLFKQMSDSLINEANTKKIARLETTYEFQQEKDSLYQASILQSNQLKQEQLTNKFQRNINLLISVVLGIVAVFAFFAYRSRQYQKHLNTQLSQQKEDLRETYEELRQSQEEVFAQKNAIENQNELLSAQNLKISQSINAAQTIQEAILPLNERMQQDFKEHFVIYSPKDVVSGDFYWYDKIENKQILGAIDCTGHGIPGAFMSMIGFTLLNKIISTHKITDPAGILENMRHEIHHTLKQDTTGKQSGMDAAFVTIQSTKDALVQVEFAGARRPLWYIDQNSSEVQEIRGAKISVGIVYKNTRTIVNNTLHFQPNTLIYLGSDGFADQNDATQNKLSPETLREMIYEISHLPLSEQKRTLVNALDKHMQGTEQRDDILLLGIKV